MRVQFTQIYIEPGVVFAFSTEFQCYLSDTVTALVRPTEKFNKRYGSDWDVIFNVSAKRAIEDNEIRGPMVFRKSKDVEYTVFLPFDVASRDSDIRESGLRFLFKGTQAVLDRLGIDAADFAQCQEEIIRRIRSDPSMFGI